MVVGGGVIGVEYACMFATLGVRVIIVESDHVSSNLPIQKSSRRSATRCVITAPQCV
jgi:pyruvate/2-oxoglutarate dehydrogenase complex dihydrolipoamide dehydrogenase (E3) component